MSDPKPSDHDDDEITPEMIEAGAILLRECDPAEDSWAFRCELAAEIYREMARLRARDPALGSVAVQRN